MFAVTEVRWAARYHVCTTCSRPIDEEQFTRTFIAEGRHQTTVIKECLDCRPYR